MIAFGAQQEMYEQAAGRQRTAAIPQTTLQVPRVPKRPLRINTVGIGIGLMMVVARLEQQLGDLRSGDGGRIRITHDQMLPHWPVEPRVGAVEIERGSTLDDGVTVRYRERITKLVLGVSEVDECFLAAGPPIRSTA
jgi:hypothetical protein